VSCPSLDPHVYFLLDLLRVIRKGPVVKAAVDDAIDQCAEVFNLRDSIEEARIRAEQAKDEREKKSFAQKGRFHPYFHANVSLIPLKASRVYDGTLSSSFSRHICNRQSRIPWKLIKPLKPS
jgi:hypothetical protein